MKSENLDLDLRNRICYKCHPFSSPPVVINNNSYNLEVHFIQLFLLIKLPMEVKKIES